MSAALRLLAAAEANDGTTPESDAIRELCYESSFPREVCEESHAKIERERNGLAARVRELEKDAERYRWLRATTKGVRDDAGNMREPVTTPEAFAAAIDAARSKP